MEHYQVCTPETTASSPPPTHFPLTRSALLASVLQPKFTFSLPLSTQNFTPAHASCHSTPAATCRSRTQKFLDDSVPYKVPRWAFLSVTLVIYLVRTYLIQGWYIIT